MNLLILWRMQTAIKLQFGILCELWEKGIFYSGALLSIFWRRFLLWFASLLLLLLLAFTYKVNMKITNWLPEFSILRDSAMTGLLMSYQFRFWYWLDDLLYVRRLILLGGNFLVLDYVMSNIVKFILDCICKFLLPIVTPSNICSLFKQSGQESLNLGLKTGMSGSREGFSHHSFCQVP